MRKTNTSSYQKRNMKHTMQRQVVTWRAHPPLVFFVLSPDSMLVCFSVYRWARQVMGLIELEPGLLMRSVFSFTEIYSGSKV